DDVVLEWHRDHASPCARSRRGAELVIALHALAGYQGIGEHFGHGAPYVGLQVTGEHLAGRVVAVESPTTPHRLVRAAGLPIQPGRHSHGPEGEDADVGRGESGTRELTPLCSSQHASLSTVGPLRLRAIRHRASIPPTPAPRSVGHFRDIHTVR